MRAAHIYQKHYLKQHPENTHFNLVPLGFVK